MASTTTETTEQSNHLEELVERWLRWDPDPVTRAEIQELRDKKDYKSLSARLSTRIAFGTAGLRGAMQAGFNSMNVLTVIQASQGLARYMLEVFGEEETKRRGLVVGYDGRHYSKEFARRTALTFLSLGIRVYLFSVLVPTPFVPFAVLQKKAAAGVMVTASHNPKNDNGYKVYWENGCQIVSPHDVGISKKIEQNLEPWKGVSDDLMMNSGDLLVDPKEEIDKSYYQLIKQNYSFHKGERKDIKVVYTPMHGVGLVWAEKAFAAFDINPFIPVALQKEPDPEFPTVHFPNPEEGKGALKLAIETAEETGTKLILANDPDADRLAVAEKLSNGEWKIYNGNEIGVLLAAWVWSEYKRTHPEADPANCVMISTAVSSQMLRSICKQEGLVYEETLTGFKWIGSAAEKHIKEGKTFLFGYEEAIGFMVGDICLDKDGIRGIAVFAEMAAHLASQSLSCYDQLVRLYQKYGYFVTINKYFFCYDPNVMRRIFNTIRGGGNYPTKCGSFDIVNIRDLTTGYDTNQPDKKAILPVSTSTEMISFYFSNGCLLTLRGSGTEPKLKYYAELHGNYDVRSEIEATLRDVVSAVIAEFLKPTDNGLEPPHD